MSGTHEISASWILIQVYSFLSKLWIYREYLPNILHNERTFRYKFSSQKPPSLFLSLNWIYISVLMQLKSAVSAKCSTGASLLTAFCWDNSINASLSTVERLMHIAFFALFCISCLHACALNCHCFSITKLISLPLEILILFQRSELCQRMCEQTKSFRMILYFRLSL